ncbi:MAG: redoxin domain-containing protein, partial [Pseudomonadota bacterium]
AARSAPASIRSGALGAELVAISPETPDKTAETVKKQKLGFFVLSDRKGEVIENFGLRFDLPPDLIEVYKQFGIQLDKANASRKWQLPLAATYIINKNGVIVYAFVNADYKKRAETSELIQILSRLKS